VKMMSEPGATSWAELYVADGFNLANKNLACKEGYIMCWVKYGGEISCQAAFMNMNVKHFLHQTVRNKNVLYKKQYLDIYWSVMKSLCAKNHNEAHKLFI
jgi:hypothetical protein